MTVCSAYWYLHGTAASGSTHLHFVDSGASDEAQDEPGGVPVMRGRPGRRVVAPLERCQPSTPVDMWAAPTGLDSGEPR